MARVIKAIQQNEPKKAEDAYQEGIQKGREESKAELKEMLSQIQTAAHVQQKERLESAIQLAIEIVKKILGEKARTPEVTAYIVKEALLSVGNSGVVRVHPDSIEKTKEAVGDIVRVVGDPLLQIGDCVVDTAWGLLDARLESQVEAIATAMREKIKDD